MDLINLNNDFNNKFLVGGNILNIYYFLHIKETKKLYIITKENNKTYKVKKNELFNFINENIFLNYDNDFIFNSLEDIEYYKNIKLLKNEINIKIRNLNQ